MTTEIKPITLQSRPVGSTGPWSTIQRYHAANAEAFNEGDRKKLARKAVNDALSWNRNYFGGSREFRVTGI
jgi:hypothetical protein